MRKRIIYPCMLLMAMSCCILSCEKDPSISELKSDVTRISTEDSIKAAVAADSVANVARLDSVDVNFTLLNEEGKELSTFAYGENIIFQVTLSNHSKRVVKLPTSWPLVGGEKAFMVYTKEGECIGRPWYILSVRAVYPEPTYRIDPDKSFSWACKWKGFVVDSPEEGSLIMNRGFHFVQDHKRENLAKGAYYSKFSICLGSDIYVECRKDFLVE